MEKFDPKEHEARLVERYRQLAIYKAFDALIDMALDGVITMEEAKTAWESEIYVFDEPPSPVA